MEEIGFQKNYRGAKTNFQGAAPTNTHIYAPVTQIFMHVYSKLRVNTHASGHTHANTQTHKHTQCVALWNGLIRTVLTPG